MDSSVTRVWSIIHWSTWFITWPESTASAITSIQPLKVATWNRLTYAARTLSKFTWELTHSVSLWPIRGQFSHCWPIRGRTHLSSSRHWVTPRTICGLSRCLVATSWHCPANVGMNIRKRRENKIAPFTFLLNSLNTITWMVLGIENWPNNVTGLFFASRLHWLHASWVCLHSNHSLGILNFMSELLNEQQKIDLSDFFPGWQHIRQKRGKGRTLVPCAVWLLLA